MTPPPTHPVAVDYLKPSRSSAAGRVPELVELYSLVYSEPPYNEGPEQFAWFRGHMRGELDRPGFSLVLANDDERLVGAAYGWTMAAGSWWSTADRIPGPEIHDADKFAVKEWIVHPRSRNAGIGRELLRRLLDGRDERYATLSSDPRSEARAMYARMGWRQAAKSTLPWGVDMDVLILEL
ncbi:GNAT family N-acetyltransferase [Actinoplanes sp. NPDC049668]|uniref:GNAT family N-acetyltransferase n=1 Tax=unclassified Actinoplanes TaxID=2626549 RepID=UPI0033AD577F